MVFMIYPLFHQSIADVTGLIFKLGANKLNALSNIFSDAIMKIGMCKIEHPIYYNAPIGIRFEIGGEEPIYLENTRGHTVNPEYIGAALFVFHISKDGKRDKFKFRRLHIVTEN